MYLYVKDPYEATYQHLTNKHEKMGIDDFNNPKAFIEYSNDMQDFYNSIGEYNSGKRRQILIVFDDMIADMIKNKKINSVVTY